LGVLQKIRHHLDRLAATELDPARTAAALALGVFLSFSPFLGLQILIGLGAAFAFRLSRVAVLVGLCANLPWIMVPWYMLTTAAAASVLGSSISTPVDITAGLFSVPVYELAFVERTGVIAAELFWPFLLGPTAGALVLGAVAYVVSFRMLARRRGIQPSAGDRPAGDAEQRAADRHVHDPQRARLEP
jgi:uncharacterized protein (DUF2062 family)